MNEGRKKEGRKEGREDGIDCWHFKFIPVARIRQVLCLRLTVTYVSSYAQVFFTGMWHTLAAIHV